MNIFFDLDNTLWDFSKNSKITLQEIYKNKRVELMYSVKFEKFYIHFYKKNEQLWVDLRKNLITKNELRYRRFKEAFSSVGIYNDFLAFDFEMNYLDEVIYYHFLVKGAEKLLLYLKKNKHKIHILSNGFTKSTKRKILKSKLKIYVDTIISAEEIGVFKPNAKIFEYSLKKSNSDINNSIFIGDDWIADALGALQFGLKTVFFNRLNKFSYSNNKIIEINDLLELKKII